MWSALRPNAGFGPRAARFLLGAGGPARPELLGIGPVEISEQNPVDERAYARLGVVLKEKWRLDGLLGVGGMAAVYSATHRNGKRVAVKIMHPEISANRDLTERFLREG